MPGKKSILLVEGESDRSFFEFICKQLDLENSVTVAPPRVLLGQHNSKQGVFKHLPILLDQLVDGTYERLAVVLDADCPPDGGFAYTRDMINDIVGVRGYSVPPRQLSEPHGGLVYHSDQGFNDFGLWVMPDNLSSGMLEDWIKECIAPAEIPLMGSAMAAVAGLTRPVKFSELHIPKAEVATWLAWQKRPGHGMYQVAQKNLLDPNGVKYIALINWLKHIFSV